MLRSVPVNLRLTLGTCIVLAVFSDSLLDFLTLFFSKPFSSEVAEPFVWGKNPSIAWKAAAEMLQV